MKKAKFIKTTRGTCICLDNLLFKSNVEKIDKTAKVLGAFSERITKYTGTVYVEQENEPIIKRLHNLCCCELIAIRKYFFRYRVARYGDGYRRLKTNG